VGSEKYDNEGAGSPAVTEGEQVRLVAWSAELREVHKRLRKALDVARTAATANDPNEPAGRELLLFCHGFCVALTGHHEGEDRKLFPAIATAHPELREALRALERDHSMVAHLIGELQTAVAAASSPAELERHLEGIAAIMENHFRYEERQLLSVLDTLALNADPRHVLGPYKYGQRT
jgi:hemerythrin HHE cation binding domain-containing protein